MLFELVNIGFDQFLVAHRIIAVASPISTNIKRTIEDANIKGLLVDMTQGHKTRSAVILDDGHIFLVSRAPEIMAGRLQANQVVRPLEPEPAE